MRRPIMDMDEKRRKTILKNRESAKKSAELKNERLQSLEESNNLLIRINEELRHRIEVLESLVKCRCSNGSTPLNYSTLKNIAYFR